MRGKLHFLFHFLHMKQIHIGIKYRVKYERDMKIGKKMKENENIEEDEKKPEARDNR